MKKYTYENYYKNYYKKYRLTKQYKQSLISGSRRKQALKTIEREKLLRKEVILSLGNKCCKCGFSDIRALQIDHINGNGKKEIKEIFWKKGRTFYLNHIKKIIKKNKNKYQLLCANCNWIKRVENKEYK